MLAVSNLLRIYFRFFSDVFFNFDQKKELALEELKLQEDARALQKEKDLLARERKQLVKTSLKSMEASIFLDKIGSGKCEIRLYYLVQNAGWSPIYNFYSNFFLEQNDMKNEKEK